MPKNKPHTRRSIIGAALIVAVALVGLLVTGVPPSAAKQSGIPAVTVSPADTPAADSPAPLTGYTSALPSLVRMLSALIIVIFAIYVGLYVLRRLMNRRFAGVGAPNALEVIQSAPVGPKKSVTLVRIGDRSVLLGITDEHISPLTELTEEETGRILAATQTEQATPVFSTVLQRAVGRLKEMSQGKRTAAMET